MIYVGYLLCIIFKVRLKDIAYFQLYDVLLVRYY